mgnify:FL=1
MKELHRFRQYLTEGDFKNPILDKYLEIKKSIDNKTVFDYELSDFINDLDNTERKGLESDLGLERDELYEGVIKENTEEEIKAILSKSYPGAYSEDDFEEIINLYNTKYKDYKDSYGKLDGVEQSAFKFNYANNRDIVTGMKAGSKSSPSITSPEMGGELKAPSGWTEIKDLSDMHRSEEDDEIAVKAWDAPMEGWDEENKDIIVVRKEDDKFYLDGYIPFGSFDEQGPFDTYEEALKLAVEEMEAFKEDWDEQ